MMRDYQFIDNYFHNVEVIGQSKEKEFIRFFEEIDFNNKDIFKRKEKAKNILKNFENLIHKGDYTL